MEYSNRVSPLFELGIMNPQASTKIAFGVDEEVVRTKSNHVECADLSVIPLNLLESSSLFVRQITSCKIRILNWLIQTQNLLDWLLFEKNNSPAPISSSNRARWASMADYEEIELNPEEELGFHSLPTTHSDVHTNTNSPSLQKQTKKNQSSKQKRPKLSCPEC